MKWIYLKDEIPSSSPVLYLTINDKVMLLNKKCDSWLIQKYNLVAWCYPPKKKIIKKNEKDNKYKY